jgi:hypothetical protein
MYDELSTNLGREHLRCVIEVFMRAEAYFNS